MDKEYTSILSNFFKIYFQSKILILYYVAYKNLHKIYYTNNKLKMKNIN